MLEMVMFLERGVWQCEFDMGGDRYRSIVEIKGDGERARNVISELQSRSAISEGCVQTPLRPVTLKRLDQRPSGLPDSAEGADRSLLVLSHERLAIAG